MDPLWRTCRCVQGCHIKNMGFLLRCMLLSFTLQPAAEHWEVQTRPTQSMRPTRCLQTELGWLLDDALAAMARPGGDWRPTSWRQLERDLRLRPPLADAACHYLVQLREPLESLCEH